MRFSGSFLKAPDPAGGANEFTDSDLEIYVGEDNGAPDPGEDDDYDLLDKWSRVPVEFKDGAPAGKWSTAVSEFAVAPEKVATKALSTKIKILIRGANRLHIKNLVVGSVRKPGRVVDLSGGKPIGIGGRPSLFRVRSVTVDQFLKKNPSSYLRYKLTGTVSDIRNAKYGNLTLTDDTGSVFVYGLTSKALGYGAANDRSFESLGIKVGDLLTLIGYRGVYNGTPEVVYAYHVSHETPKLPEYSVSQVMDLYFKEKVPFQLTESLVLAVNKRGFVLADMQDNTWKRHIYAYKGSEHGVKVGDIVTLVGDRTTYNGVPEIENISAIKVISSGNPAPWPMDPSTGEPEINSGAIDAIISLGHAAFCRVAGRLNKSGNYYNVSIVSVTSTSSSTSSRKVSIQYPDDANMDVEDGGIDKMDGHFVELYGFFNGISKSGDQEYFNIIPVSVRDLFLYDTPSGYSRTNDHPMMVKDAVVAGNARNTGYTSVIVLADPVKGGYVPMFYLDEPELVQAKPGDKFAYLYCSVEHETYDDNGSFSPRCLRYRGFYEGYSSGNTFEYKYMTGSFTSGSELPKRMIIGVQYMEATGVVPANSATMYLSDNFRLSDYSGYENSILYGSTSRIVTARGFYMYKTPGVGTFLFTSVEKSEEDVSQHIQEILVMQEGASVKTSNVTVCGLSSDGFVVSDNSNLIYVDLSGLSSSARASMMPKKGDRVKVSGIRTSVSSIAAPCIGGSNVNVTVNGNAPDQIPEAEEVKELKEYGMAKHIKLPGKVRYDSKMQFYTLECFGSESSYIQVYHPTASMDSLLNANIGKWVNVEAYHLGRTGSGTASIPYRYHSLIDSIEEVQEDYSSSLVMRDGNWNGRFEETSFTVNGISGVTVYALHDYSAGIVTVPAGAKSISFYALSPVEAHLSLSIDYTIGEVSLPPTISPQPSAFTVGDNNLYTIELGVPGQMPSLPYDTDIQFSWFWRGASVGDLAVYVFGLRANF